MAFEGEEGVIATHAVAVVNDTDEFAAASLRPSTRMRVAPASRAFSKQFFDDGGRAFDDLTGRDLVGDLIGENVDAAHRGNCTVRRLRASRDVYIIIHI